MNERIRAIGEKLGIVDAEGKFYSPNFEIFAEYIVKECVKEIRASHKHGNSMAKIVVKDAADHIKKHFGIK
jgi:hypothetical protein